MPFTLAHPAAILPLRRLCPRYFCLAGLAVGSIVPDVGYCFARYNGDVLAHSFQGSFIFCLPVGLVMLWIFYALREPVVNRLPERQRQLFLPLARRPMPNLLTMALSILIGVWTHQLWDTCTHPHGLLARNFAFMRVIVFSVQNHAVSVAVVLLYMSSFVGVAWTCFEFGKWRRRAEGTPTAASQRVIWRGALIVAAIAMPIEIVHHLLGSVIGFMLVGIFSLALVLWVALKFGDAPQAARTSQS